MAQVRIELKNKKGKKEVFEKLETTGKDYRLALQTIKKLNAEKVMAWDQLDIYLAFAVEIFKADKLTSDQILDGLPSEKTRETLDGLLGQVIGVEDNPDPDAKKVTPEEAEEMYMELCRELTKQGWSLSDIENNSFDTLIEIACVRPKKEKPKEVDLKDFVKSI